MEPSLLLPYFKLLTVRFQTPSGSSSGSCVGVAAGFAPIAFGAETDGSAVQPASRAAVFALKATPALADTSGTQPGNSDFDSLGVMSKSVIDILNLWNCVLAPESAKVSRSDLTSEWKGLRVGFVDPNMWQPADFVTEPNEEFKEQSVGGLQYCLKLQNLPNADLGDE
jgi:amidase